MATDNDLQQQWLKIEPKPVQRDGEGIVDYGNRLKSWAARAKQWYTNERSRPAQGQQTGAYENFADEMLDAGNSLGERKPSDYWEKKAAGDHFSFGDKAFSKQGEARREQRAAVDRWKKLADGEGLAADRTGQIARNRAQSQALSLGASGGRYNPTRMRQALSAGADASAKIAEQQSVAAIQEKQQALANLSTATAGLRQQDLAASGQAYTRDANLAKIKSGFLQQGMSAAEADRQARLVLGRAKLAAGTTLAGQDKSLEAATRQADAQSGSSFLGDMLGFLGGVGGAVAGKYLSDERTKTKVKLGSAFGIPDDLTGYDIPAPPSIDLAPITPTPVIPQDGTPKAGPGEVPLMPEAPTVKEMVDASKEDRRKPGKYDMLLAQALSTGLGKMLQGLGHHATGANVRRAAPLRTMTFLSDEKAKDKKEGEPNMIEALEALKAAAFKYKAGYGDDGKSVHVGVMAQDLAKTPAGATIVVKQPNGLLAVDKDKALQFLLAGLSAVADDLADLKKGKVE